ncbi:MULTISPECIES: hypothetical protein [Flavobacterium]|jgi:hypothetical protein|uniref:Uncharacterized protein n=1 Tax=Flavobacterium panici TaxID=2654843 RepID=A0A9N8J629_9FLAO|nr:MULTISPECIES: hypothetical protein [Flavobacterium]MDR6764481.1 hypothetical protein [Flavobacterium sp. 2755]CAC9975927.1 hypothetical protein FLAPXU55_03648 [Flavobacterium panici]
MNKLKPFSISIILLFVSAFIMSKSTQQFRYVDKWRWLYHVGWISCYTFQIISLVLSFMFLIFILKKDFNLNIKYKFIWIALGLFPTLFWLLITIFIVGFKM